MKPLSQRSDGELVWSMLMVLTSDEDSQRLFASESNAQKRSAELPDLLSDLSPMDPRVERVIELLRVLDQTLDEAGIETVISRLKTPFDFLAGQLSSLQTGVNAANLTSQLILDALKSDPKASDQVAEGIARTAEAVIKKHNSASTSEDREKFSKWYSEQNFDDPEEVDVILKQWRIWQRKNSKI